MRTVSAATHVVRLVAGLCEERGVAALTTEQQAAVRTAVERVYGVPLDLPTPEDLDELKSRLARPRK